MMRPLLLPLLLLTASCGNRTTKAPAPAADTNGAGMQTVAADTLPPLTTGEQRLKSDIFGPEIALTGRTIETDDIFQISEVCAICKDSLLIINTLQKSGAPLRIYSLPTMKLDTTMGRFGRGPEEYIYPKIYPYASPGYLALLIDNIKEDGKMRRITSDGRIETFATRIPVPYFKYSYTRDFAAQDEQHMVFTFGSKIYRYDDNPTLPADSTVRPVADLRFGRSGRNSTRYMGSLGVNFKYKRIAWAYKYDKRLLIADFEGHVRTLQFDNPGNAVAEGMSMDANTTHYWKLYPGENYLYLYYSGRTPMEVGAEQRRGKYYAFIEQFDWNGNPVRRYRIDNWGYFAVDESRKALYVISTTDEFPFVKYELQ